MNLQYKFIYSLKERRAKDSAIVTISVVLTITDEAKASVSENNKTVWRQDDIGRRMTRRSNQHQSCSLDTCAMRCQRCQKALFLALLRRRAIGDAKALVLGESLHLSIGS
jgi:hypothetical protein